MNASELSDRDFVEWVRAHPSDMTPEDDARIEALSGADPTTEWDAVCDIAILRLDLAAALQRAETAEQKGRDYEKHIVELLAQIVDAKHETENVRVAFETACAFVLNNPKEVVLIGRSETDRMRVALKPLVVKLETVERALAEARKDTSVALDLAVEVIDASNPLKPPDNGPSSYWRWHRAIRATIREMKTEIDAALNPTKEPHA